MGLSSQPVVFESEEKHTRFNGLHDLSSYRAASRALACGQTTVSIQLSSASRAEAEPRVQMNATTLRASEYILIGMSSTKVSSLLRRSSPHCALDGDRLPTHAVADLLRPAGR